MLFISPLKPSKSDFAVIVLPNIVIIAKWYLTNYHHVNCKDNKCSPAAVGSVHGLTLQRLHGGPYNYTCLFGLSVCAYRP